MAAIAIGIAIGIGIGIGIYLPHKCGILLQFATKVWYFWDHSGLFVKDSIQNHPSPIILKFKQNLFIVNP